MCPNQIKRENADNTFRKEMTDILVLLVQVVWENLQLPNVGQLCNNVGHWKVYDMKSWCIYYKEIKQLLSQAYVVM